MLAGLLPLAHHELFFIPVCPQYCHFTEEIECKRQFFVGGEYPFDNNFFCNPSFNPNIDPDCKCDEGYYKDGPGGDIDSLYAFNYGTYMCLKFEKHCDECLNEFDVYIPVSHHLFFIIMKRSI